jgi:hypothetical protein
VLANPFFQRGPIRDPVYFFGREHETGQILSLLGHGQSVALIGPRRMGKTSLLFHLSNPAVVAASGLSLANHLFIYLDCNSLSELDQPGLCRILLEQVNEMLATRNSPSSQFIRLDEGSPVTFRALERACRELTRLGWKLTLLLDGFGRLSQNPHLDPDFFSGLRALAAQYSLTFLTVSQQPLLGLTYANASVLSSSFFNIFVTLRLGLLSEAEAQALLTGLAARSGVTLAPATLAFLLDLAGTQPLLLQMAGYSLFELQADPGAPLREHDRNHIRRHFLAEAEAHWSYAWKNLSVEDRKHLALFPLTQHTHPEATRRLEQAGLVRRREAEVRLLSPAFQEFVARQAVPGLLQAPPFTLERDRHLALCRGRPLSLTPTEFSLLAYLVAHAGQVVPHRELELHVWNDISPVKDPNRLKTTLKTLRRALGDDAVCIQNVRGVGYRFQLGEVHLNFGSDG